MLKNVGIAGKLAVIVLLPMLGLAYFAGSKVLDKADTASGAGRLQQDTRLAVEVSALRARGAEGARADRAVRRQQGRQVRRAS